MTFRKRTSTWIWKESWTKKKNKWLMKSNFVLRIILRCKTGRIKNRLNHNVIRLNYKFTMSWNNHNKCDRMGKSPFTNFMDRFFLSSLGSSISPDSQAIPKTMPFSSCTHAIGTRQPLSEHFRNMPVYGRVPRRSSATVIHCLTACKMCSVCGK